MYALSIEAVATGKAGKYTANNRHAMLVFVRAETHEQASEIAVHELSDLGWKLITFGKAKIIADDPAIISDRILRESAESALKNGCGVVVYDDPLVSRSENAP